MMDTNNFTEKFYEKYGNRSDKPVLFFSPGRVNLIGEHTDYNGGFGTGVTNLFFFSLLEESISLVNIRIITEGLFFHVP